jgi:hypothetical protein
VITGLALMLAATAAAGYTPSAPASDRPPRASHSWHYPWQGRPRDHFTAAGPGSAKRCRTAGAGRPVLELPRPRHRLSAETAILTRERVLIRSLSDADSTPEKLRSPAQRERAGHTKRSPQPGRVFHSVRSAEPRRDAKNPLLSGRKFARQASLTGRESAHVIARLDALHGTGRR